MAAPYIHAISSAKKYGGTPEDYLDIHELMDSSKITFADNRHRVLTHNIWFITVILPKVFGHQRENSDGKKYNVKDIDLWHEKYDHSICPFPFPAILQKRHSGM